MSVSKPYAIDHGVANLSFVPDTHGDWALESGIYEIQPIPEPGTWLLVPTGSRLGVAGPQEKTWSVVRGDSPRDGLRMQDSVKEYAKAARPHVTPVLSTATSSS
jgi:hypothetical protein